MIKDLLSAYYKAFGTDPSHEIVQSMVIDGHEVAWMKYTGTVVCDITGRGREGETYEGYGLYCECDFTKGVGWDINEDGKPRKILGSKEADHPCAENCVPRQEAVRLRLLELREEYKQHFSPSLEKHIPEIIMNLIEKAKADEFIEDGNGAEFWGGYFYLQTVASIVGDIKKIPMKGANFELTIEQPGKYVWEAVEQLQKEKKIMLEGMIVQSYREPPPPAWEECFRIEDDDGWIGIALLPQHHRMKSEWKFEILRPDGYMVYQDLPMPTLPLMYPFDFGPDLGDVAPAEDKIKELIEEAKKRITKE